MDKRQAEAAPCGLQAEGRPHGIHVLYRNFWILCVLTLPVVAYIPALRGGFIWDDQVQFISSPIMAASDGIRRIWFGTETQQYYPVTFTLFWLQHRLWGGSPLGYHALNLALHILNALLLWRLLKRWDVPGGGLAAALFVLHPVHVESVAWISELKNVLSGTFYLASLTCYVRFEEEEKSALYPLALVLFLLALLSKTATIMLPVVLILSRVWKERPWSREAVFRLLPFFLLSALMAGVTITYERFVGAPGDSVPLALSDKIALAGKIICFYFAKLAAPYPLATIYPRWPESPQAWTKYIPTIGVILSAIFLWLGRLRWGRAPLICLAYSIITLFPVLGFFHVEFMKLSFVADHFQYLASMGPIVLMAAGMAAIGRRWLGKGRHIAVGILLLLLGALTWRQAGRYTNDEVFWKAVSMENSQAWVAHYNLGVLLAEQSRLPEAVAHFQECLRITPGNVDARNNLALALLRQGALDAAILHFTQALRIKPTSLVHANLASAWATKGNLPRTIENYRQAIRLDPASAHYNAGLASALQASGRTAEAVEYYKQAIALSPENAEYQDRMGSTLFAANDYGRAIEHFERALSLQPDFAQARYNLALVLIKRRNFGKAMIQLREALRLKPDIPEAEYQTGYILESTGNREGALLHYRKALALYPSWKALQEHLSSLENQRKKYFHPTWVPALAGVEN